MKGVILPAAPGGRLIKIADADLQPIEIVGAALPLFGRDRGSKSMADVLHAAAANLLLPSRRKCSGGGWGGKKIEELAATLAGVRRGSAASAGMAPACLPEIRRNGANWRSGQ